MVIGFPSTSSLGNYLIRYYTGTISDGKITCMQGMGEAA